MLVKRWKNVGRIVTLRSLLINNFWLSGCYEIFFIRLFLQDFDLVSDKLSSHWLIAKIVLVLLEFGLTLGSFSSTLFGVRDISSLLVFGT